MNREPEVQTKLLAVDGGQSSIRLECSGQPLLRLPGVKTDQPILPQLARAIQRAAKLWNTEFDIIAIGTTGLTSADYDARKLRELLEPQLQVGQIMLTHDSVSSYLGALGEKPGVVVAAGTGVVVLGVGQHATARVDGWGNIMGDLGSAYWIGAQVLASAMQAHDGRGPDTILKAVVMQRWPQLEDAYIQLQNDPDKIAVVASFAQEATAAAPTDPVAAGIVQQAAEHLAHSAATALQSCALQGSAARVALLGGVFKSGLIRERFVQALGQKVGHVELVEPKADGLSGISLMPDLGERHALWELISRN